MRDSTTAYETAKRLGLICRSSKTLEEARAMALKEFGTQDYAHIVEALSHLIGENHVR
jgi:hypothetical protein